MSRLTEGDPSPQSSPPPLPPPLPPSSAAAASRSGLRERKKARTKAAIQRHAVRLFREQGYGSTTVEQIAEAAEVSPSTVFRYFPTKEDLVVSDDYDPLIATAYAAQPAELSPVQAFRAALGETIREIPAEDIQTQRERTILILSVPELWGANLRNIRSTLQLICEMVAKRVGREPGDPAVVAFASATFGIMLQVMLRWADEPDLDMVAEIDDALARLDAGLPL